MNLNKKLLNLIESIANSPKRAGLESDALSALIHYRLTEEGFQAEHLSGVVTFDGVTVPYEWLTFRGLVIDYRLKLQFSEKAEVPHGIFDSEEWPTVQYQVKEVVPVIGAVDYSFLVNVRRPRLLRGVPGICPPENLTQGRHDYLESMYPTGVSERRTCRAESVRVFSRGLRVESRRIRNTSAP